MNMLAMLVPLSTVLTRTSTWTPHVLERSLNTGVETAVMALIERVIVPLKSVVGVIVRPPVVVAVGSTLP
jgi:hypothetical protein